MPWANSVAELTAYLKARPGKTNFGSGSSTGLVGGYMYVGMAKLDTVHVPYKGMPQVYQDLMAGRWTSFMPTRRSASGM